MAKPAIEGIQRILRAAEHAGVKRVVMTANFGAVGFSNKDKNSITNESHWTNEDEPGLSVYEKSKLLAEKAAWDFVENENTTVEFATINPVAILVSLDARFRKLSFIRKFIEWFNETCTSNSVKCC